MTIKASFETVAVDTLAADPDNARTHSNKQIEQLVLSYREFGPLNPPLVDENGMIIAGHGRLLAIKRLGLTELTVIRLEGLSKAQKRKLALADNKIPLNAGWDRSKLSVQLNDLVFAGEDLEVTGFSAPEIEELSIDLIDEETDPADEPEPIPDVEPVSKSGDLFRLGVHWLKVGDARRQEDVADLCADRLASMVFTDPPYNQKISSLVGRGKTKHREFPMASGEMGPAEFEDFLETTLRNTVAFCRDGALCYVCMDWRGIEVLLRVCRKVMNRLVNIVVWVKSNAGQGSFYRSQYEVIVVCQVGLAIHLNNIELGRHGRNRSNVWNFPGVNSFGKGRMADLKMHPTVKPVAMIVEALKDCTKRGDDVLDLFGGSGSTLMACEKVGRRAMLMEIDPAYVDLTIRRWQRYTGKDAVHIASGKTFDQLAAEAAAAAANGEVAP